MIDLDKYLVTIGGADVTLTKKEVELLWTLAKNSSKVFSRENLLDSIWGYDYFGDSPDCGFTYQAPAGQSG